MFHSAMKRDSVYLVLMDEFGNLNAQRYINKVLVPEVIPFLLQNVPNLNFQQDNARPHVARVVNDFFYQNDVDRLPWPALSSDLSPIQHLWDELSRRTHNANQQINTVAQLRQALVRQWNNLPNALVQRYVNSMRRADTSMHSSEWRVDSVLTF